MNDYKITKIEKSNDDVVFSPKTDSEINDIFDSLIEVNSDDLIVKDSCKLCNHRLRYEAERYWEGCNSNYTQTVQWLNDQINDFNSKVTSNDQKEALFSFINVRNHMRNHLADQKDSGKRCH